MKVKDINSRAWLIIINPRKGKHQKSLIFENDNFSKIKIVYFLELLKILKNVFFTIL